MRTTAIGLLVSALAVLAAGCGTAQGDDASSGRELTVLAASSLTGTFSDLATRFEADHPGVHVTLAFDSSATLAEQVAQGAPADVLATADERTMDTVVAADGTAGAPGIFATNRLRLVTPRDNPAGIASFADLDAGGVDYVVCVDSAPCGAAATAALDSAGVSRPPASEEVDVKAVLSTVALGEADAGLVYATDARAAGSEVRSLPVPGAATTENPYPIAVLSESSVPALAQEWVDLVRSAQGQRILTEAGFGAP